MRHHLASTQYLLVQMCYHVCMFKNTKLLFLFSQKWSTQQQCESQLRILNKWHKKQHFKEHHIQYHQALLLLFQVLWSVLPIIEYTNIQSTFTILLEQTFVNASRLLTFSHQTSVTAHCFHHTSISAILESTVVLPSVEQNSGIWHNNMTENV
jgi:hypothetical protein